MKLWRHSRELVSNSCHENKAGEHFENTLRCVWEPWEASRQLIIHSLPALLSSFSFPVSCDGLKKSLPNIPTSRHTLNLRRRDGSRLETLAALSTPKCKFAANCASFAHVQRLAVLLLDSIKHELPHGGRSCLDCRAHAAVVRDSEPGRQTGHTNLLHWRHWRTLWQTSRRVRLQRNAFVALTIHPADFLHVEVALQPKP